MSHIENNPFIHSQLDLLMEAKLSGDTTFINDWTNRALRAYEATRHREIWFQKKAIKWDKMIDVMGHVFDKDDLAFLEYGRD